MENKTSFMDKLKTIPKLYEKVLQACESKSPKEEVLLQTKAPQPQEKNGLNFWFGGLIFTATKEEFAIKNAKSKVAGSQIVKSFDKIKDKINWSCGITPVAILKHAHKVKPEYGYADIFGKLVLRGYIDIQMLYPIEGETHHAAFVTKKNGARVLIISENQNPPFEITLSRYCQKYGYDKSALLKAIADIDKEE